MQHTHTDTQNKTKSEVLALMEKEKSGVSGSRPVSPETINTIEGTNLGQLSLNKHRSALSKDLG